MCNLSAPSGCPDGLSVNYNEFKPTTAELSWTPVPKDKQNGVIIGYTIEIVGSDPSCTQKVETEKADATSADISNLNPFTEYTFKVCAKTKAGSGPAKSIKSETPEAGETRYSGYT